MHFHIFTYNNTAIHLHTHWLTCMMHTASHRTVDMPVLVMHTHTHTPHFSGQAYCWLAGYALHWCAGLYRHSIGWPSIDAHASNATVLAGYALVRMPLSPQYMQGWCAGLYCHSTGWLRICALVRRPLAGLAGQLVAHWCACLCATVLH